ncbi:MAG: flavin reductase family protein [Solirubrobacteraceae bacterium]
MAGSEGCERAFQRIVAELGEPMLIVTAAADGERSGCLVGFATQTSIHPPRFLVCVSHRNHTHGVALRATHLGVHVVPEGARALAELFGGETGDAVDKFAHVAWRDGPHGVPLLDDCPSWLVGEILWRRDAGDHDAFALAPVFAEHGGTDDELRFEQAKDIEPGHAP